MCGRAGVRANGRLRIYTKVNRIYDSSVRDRPAGLHLQHDQGEKHAIVAAGPHLGDEGIQHAILIFTMPGHICMSRCQVAVTVVAG